MRGCSTELNEKRDITEAKKACDLDTKCSYLSTDNMDCEGKFKLCNGTELKYSKYGCTLQKG